MTSHDNRSVLSGHALIDLGPGRGRVEFPLAVLLEDAATLSGTSVGHVAEATGRAKVQAYNVLRALLADGLIQHEHRPSWYVITDAGHAVLDAIRTADHDPRGCPVCTRRKGPQSARR